MTVASLGCTVAADDVILKVWGFEPTVGLNLAAVDAEPLGVVPPDVEPPVAVPVVELATLGVPEAAGSCSCTPTLIKVDVVALP